MPLDKDELFATQREVIKEQANDIDSSFLGEYSQRVPISPDQGKGFFDFHYFDNVLLGRADCEFVKDTSFSNDKKQFSYGFQIMLSGELSFGIEEPKLYQMAQAPEIWLSKGNFGSTHVNIRGEHRVRNVLIEFTPDFIESIAQESSEDSLCAQLINSEEPNFIRLPAPTATTIKKAWELYDYEGATSHLELMAIQGATLSFISHLLNEPQVEKFPVSYSRMAAKRAQVILDTRYAEKWPTRKLAREAVTNECDLKREFKILTGTTINHYQRNQRMLIAMELLQSGEVTLAGITELLGYQNKDYFVRVFRQYYGFHPVKAI